MLFGKVTASISHCCPSISERLKQYIRITVEGVWESEEVAKNIFSTSWKLTTKRGGRKREGYVGSMENLLVYFLEREGNIDLNGKEKLDNGDNWHKKIQLSLFLAQNIVDLSFLFLLLIQRNKWLHNPKNSPNLNASNPINFCVLVAFFS